MGELRGSVELTLFTTPVREQIYVHTQTHTHTHTYRHRHPLHTETVIVDVITSTSILFIVHSNWGAPSWASEVGR